MERKVDVRLAVPEDFTLLARLAGQLGPEQEPAQVRTRLLDLLKREDHVVYIAEAAGDMAGWIHAYLYRPLHKEIMVEIAGLVVEKNSRRMGIGRRLLEAVEEWAKAHGCSQVCLDSNIVRKEAHQFYQRVGYELSKTQYTFRKELKAEV
ncbi:MAG: GNAT family N-acetyltransferase [Firmicutes bacterium]|nr:GNAT family N-acetyltransferase [Bacillota bacterium]